MKGYFLDREGKRNSDIDKPIFFSIAKWEIISNNEKQQVKFDILGELRC